MTGRIAADLRLKDGTTIPLGSKVTGHVTEAKARSKGDAQSALGIVFDKISSSRRERAWPLRARYRRWLRIQTQAHNKPAPA